MWIIFPTFAGYLRSSNIPVGAGSDTTALKPGLYLYMSLARPSKVVQGFLTPLYV
jgi:hypothetical protein